MSQPVRVFFSYSHEDDKHRFALEKHLKMLEREGLVESWYDRKILPGEDWATSIDRELARAEIILFLVSADFLASEYCWGVEVKTAMERHEKGEALVVPVLVRACDWQSAPFGKIHGLPKNVKPVTSWNNLDEAWTDVAKGLRRLIASLSLEGRPEPGIRVKGTRIRPTRYLEALDTRTSYVELRGMGAKVAERLPLDRVYTKLRVTGSGVGETKGRDKSKDPEELRAMHHGERDASLADVLRQNRSAVLIGDPGSGKTTFLRFAAQRLARAYLSDDFKAVEEELGIADEKPFPILVRLTDFTAFLGDHDTNKVGKAAPEHLLSYLDFSLQGHGYDLPATYLRDRFQAGGCFLLLDGLDEVAAPLRRRVASIVESLVTEANGDNRLLLTCRTRAYAGKANLLPLPAFPLAEFGPQQVEEFVRQWCLALHKVPTGVPSKTPEAVQAEEYRQSLQETITSHPNVGPLTANPLMLTMLAVVHWTRRQLPEQRAELYQVAVDYLMESRKGLSPYPTQLRQEALQALALKMFEDEDGLRRSYGMVEAAEVVAGVLAVGQVEAKAFLESETLHSGLLVSQTEGEVEFWHLTFQEFLAALELATGREYWESIEPRLFDDQWNEVVLLLGSCLRKKDGLHGARLYLERILASKGSDQQGFVGALRRFLAPILGAFPSLPSKARAVGLSGRILQDIRPYGGDPAAGTDFEQFLEETLAIFQRPKKGQKVVAENIRVEVGEALGQTGDPRLQDEARLRVPLEGGTFLMGAQSTDAKDPGYDEEADPDEAPVRRITISPFEMGRYPVTVAQYSKFLESGEEGYLNPRQWDPKGWAWREAEGIEEPDEWTAQLRYPNRPVVGVSWYEADAYCRWMGGSLPTEAQWEYAARGKEGRKYPWSKRSEPTNAHANFGKHVKTPTPVGAYPLGATPEGVHDLAGNVLEWCSDWWENPRQGENLTDPEGSSDGSSRVLRGGAFNGIVWALRGASRSYGHPPVLRFEDVGFRVVFVGGCGLEGLILGPWVRAVRGLLRRRGMFMEEIKS